MSAFPGLRSDLATVDEAVRRVVLDAHVLDLKVSQACLLVSVRRSPSSGGGC